ncbi:MAG: phage/plasmid primase, P4 family [Bacteroidia bacterium]
MDNPETILSHVQELLKEVEPVPHKRILSLLLDKITLVDFADVADLDQDSKVKTNHYLIITVEQILNLSVLNRWGICKNLDFIYLYNGAYWSLLDREEIIVFLGEAAEKMGVDKFKARHFIFREHLYKQFMTLANLPKPDMQQEKVLINLKNGTFEITPTGHELRPFAPKDFMTYQLPFSYDPEATAPLFMQYLNKVLPDIQRQDVLAEYLGYVFIRNGVLKEEKVLFLYGTGANGKSVFHEVVKALLGPENTSQYSLQSLTNEHGYYRAMIANKLVNYASEISGKLQSATFKQLASGETVEARLPYGNPMQISDYARLIFNVNELPKDVEQTNAFFRRFLIVPFDITIPEGEQDKQLHTKIIQSELSGVFNWMLWGLARLLEQRKFSTCDASETAREKYRTESDSVKMFLLEEGYSRSQVQQRPLKDLYSEYKSYCQDGGYNKCSLRTVSERLRNMGFQMTRRSMGMYIDVEKKDLSESTLATLPTSVLPIR